MRVMLKKTTHVNEVLRYTKGYADNNIYSKSQK